MIAFFSATDRAIKVSSMANTLRLVDRVGRFGAFVSIENSVGVIEVHDTMAQAMARVAECTE